MKLSFLELPPDERRLYIEQAATRRNVSPVILEKDFWVCFQRIAAFLGSRFVDRKSHRRRCPPSLAEGGSPPLGPDLPVRIDLPVLTAWVETLVYSIRVWPAGPVP